MFGLAVFGDNRDAVLGLLAFGVLFLFSHDGGIVPPKSSLAQAAIGHLITMR